MDRKHDAKKRVTTFCCVAKCKTYSDPKVYFHYFPKKHNLKRKWEIALRMGKSASQYMRVCSKHFTSQDYFPGGLKRHKLFPTSIPSQNIPQQSFKTEMTSPKKPQIEVKLYRAKLRAEKQRKSNVAINNIDNLMSLMGKKRNVQPSPIMPGRIKVEIKNEIGDSDVLVARDRLKGALRELLQHSDTGSSAESDDSPISDYKHSMKKMTKSMNIQPRKVRRRRPIQTDAAFHHTYVMKLFDRSVDLAQFQEDTPLYPICRAWMANQPRNPHLVPKMRSPSPEIINEVNMANNLIGTDGEINDVHYLPPPLPREEAIPKNRIPSPILGEKDDLNLDYEGQILKTREQLMKDHTERWNAIRKKWHQQAHKNEQRYSQSATILNTIFTKAQSEFE